MGPCADTLERVGSQNIHDESMLWLKSVSPSFTTLHLWICPFTFGLSDVQSPSKSCAMYHRWPWVWTPYNFTVTISCQTPITYTLTSSHVAHHQYAQEIEGCHCPEEYELLGGATINYVFHLRVIFLILILRLATVHRSAAGVADVPIPRTIHM